MNLENYRSINLLSTILKLIQKYDTKIQRYFEVEGLTAAFRKGQLCSNIIFVVSEIIEKFLEFNAPDTCVLLT